MTTNNHAEINLSPKLYDILMSIINFQKNNNRPPSLKEQSTELGLSINAVGTLRGRLLERGIITRLDRRETTTYSINTCKIRINGQSQDIVQKVNRLENRYYELERKYNEVLIKQVHINEALLEVINKWKC